MYNFYDYEKGYADGYSPDKYLEACTYANKNEIIMWAFGFKAGRDKWNLENTEKNNGMTNLQLANDSYKDL